MRGIRLRLRLRLRLLAPFAQRLEPPVPGGERAPVAYILLGLRDPKLQLPFVFLSVCTVGSKSRS